VGTHTGFGTDDVLDATHRVLTPPGSTPAGPGTRNNGAGVPEPLCAKFLGAVSDQL